MTVMHCSLSTLKARTINVEHNSLWAQHCFGLYAITLLYW